MVLNPQEQEFLNKLKAFWREYGIALAAGVGLSLAAVVGWNFFQSYQAGKLEEANQRYQGFLQLSNSHDLMQQAIDLSYIEQTPDEPAEITNLRELMAQQGISTPNEDGQVEFNRTILEARRGFIKEQMTEIADTLAKEQPTLAYTGFAGLRLAGIDVAEGNLEAAGRRLTPLFQHAKSPEVTRLLGLMFGRTLLNQNLPDQALAVVNDKRLAELESFPLSELRGDIYAAKGETETALEHYNLALEQGGDAALLNYKISLLASPLN